MKKILIYPLLIFNSGLLAQTTFTNTYNVDPVNNRKYSFDESHTIFEHNNSLFTIGTFEENTENSQGVYDGVPDTTHAMLMKYDQTGKVIYNNLYTPNSCYASTYLYSVKNDYMIATGLIYSPKNFCGFYDPDQPPPNVDITLKRRIYITSTHLETGLKKERIYRTGEDSYPFGIDESNDGNFFVANVIEKNRVLCLLKINSNGDSISNKVIFDSIPYDYEPILFAKTETGYLIFLTSQLSGNTHIELLDKEGNLISFKNLGFAPRSISKTNDGGYIFLNTHSNVKPMLTKMDKDFNVEWQKKYDLYGYSFVKQTSDGNYLIGTKDFAKVSKDTILWSKRYFGENNITPWYFIFDAVETSDGGFALTGFYDANTFLVKTDCNGELVWDSNSCKPKEETKKLEVSVYPNPFNETITFKLADITDSVIKIIITDMLGQTIHTSQSPHNFFSINSSSISAGVYLCAIYVNNKNYKTVKLIKN